MNDSPQLPILNWSVIPDYSLPQDDATVKCWGANSHGQLGLGDTTSRGGDANGPCPAQHHHSVFLADHTWPAPPPCLLCLPRVSSLWFVLLACRDGGEPHFGRPGGWEDGRSHQLSFETYVRSVGKTTQWEIRRWERAQWQ